MVPAFWFEQQLDLDEKLAAEASMAIQLPEIGIYAAYGIAGLGLVLVIVGGIATYTKRWNSYETLEDETADDSPIQQTEN